MDRDPSTTHQCGSAPGAELALVRRQFGANGFSAPEFGANGAIRRQQCLSPEFGAKPISYWFSLMIRNMPSWSRMIWQLALVRLQLHSAPIGSSSAPFGSSLSTWRQFGSNSIRLHSIPFLSGLQSVTANIIPLPCPGSKGTCWHPRKQCREQWPRSTGSASHIMTHV